MSTTSKSPRKVIETALAVAEQSLPEYSHVYSPRKFTQHQLFACLVLKSFLDTDYRGVVQLLDDCPSLADAIGLKRIPHFTTLQKAAQRLLLRKNVNRLLAASLKRAMGSPQKKSNSLPSTLPVCSRIIAVPINIKRRSREPISRSTRSPFMSRTTTANPITGSHAKSYQCVRSFLPTPVAPPKSRPVESIAGKCKQVLTNKSMDNVGSAKPSSA